LHQVGVGTTDRHNNSAAGTPVLSLNRDDDNATFAGNVTTSGTINVNRLAGGTPYDNFKITTADIVTTLERVENTGDNGGGYGRLDFKTNATTATTPPPIWPPQDKPQPLLLRIPTSLHQHRTPSQ